MRETKGILFAIISLGMLIAFNSAYVSNIINENSLVFFRWVAAICLLVGILDALQVISVFSFKENNKLLEKMQRRPERKKQPWEE